MKKIILLTVAAAALCGAAWAQEAVDERVIIRGPIDPEAALEYMLHTERLSVIDVRGRAEKRFSGAVVIPMMDIAQDAIDAAIMAIPDDRPVIINCNQGIGAKKLYDRIREIRPWLADVMYIDGVPLFDEYAGRKQRF